MKPNELRVQQILQKHPFSGGIPEADLGVTVAPYLLTS